MDGTVEIEVKIGSKSFDEEIKQTENYLKRLQASYEKALTGKYKPDENAMAKLRLEIEKTNNKLSNLRKKQDEINNQDMVNFRNSVQNVGNSITNVVSKLGRWTIAIFGIRSAYNFVRQSMSTLSQYNDQMATDVEYIKYLLASTLQPVIETLIQLAYKLLAYVNYLAKAWFGVDLFANASADAFRRNKEQISGANKNAKELQKTLTGFDKVNILQDNGSTSIGGGGGGISVPSFSPMENVEIPSWLEWIKDNGELVKNILILIGSAILALKYNLDLIGFLGLTIVIQGILDLIIDIKNFLDKPTWKNFLKILKDIGVVLAGFGLIVGLSTTLGKVLLVIGALITAISTLITWLNSQNKATKLLTESQEKLKKAQDNLKSSTDDYINAVDNAEASLTALKEAQEKTGLSGEELYRKVEEGILDYKNMTAEQREVYKAYINNKNAQDQLKTSTENVTKAKKEEEKQSILNKLRILDEGMAYTQYKEKVVKAFKEGKISATEAKDLINSAMRNMSVESKKTFITDLPNDIKKGLEPKNYEYVWEKFKNAWNKFIGSLTTTVHISSSGEYHGGGSRGFATGGLAYYKPIKLASGAVINQPGRGVPISKALGGEAGAEGIIPLTDESALEKIGSTIGKHTKLSADITLELESRVLARIMKEINADKTFARNGG